MFSHKYGVEDLEVATQSESGPSCNAQRSTISGVCDFHKGDVNKQQIKQQNPAMFG